MTAVGQYETRMPTTDSSMARSMSRRSSLFANVWLLFLLFPVLSVWFGDQGLTRRALAVGLVALFAVLTGLGNRALIRSELGLDHGSAGRTWWWFASMVMVNLVAFVVAGWPMLGLLPFIVSSAVFQFRWPIALTVWGACLAATIVIPALTGILAEAWSFSLLVFSVGAAASMMRANDEHQLEQGQLRTQLAISDERNRVARDVHDVLGHSLTIVILKTQVCARLLDRLETLDPVGRQDVDKLVAQTRSQLGELESVSRGALAEIRATVGGLRSSDLADEIAAARVVLADAGVELVVLGDVAQVDPEDRSLLGWVVRESVTNIVRHARADRCEVAIAPHDGPILLRVADNGVGIGDRVAGNGLAGLSERVERHGARLRVIDDAGTVVEVMRESSGRT